MTLQASGQIRISEINAELGLSGSTSDTRVAQSSFRGLAGVATGQIRISDFYGKSNVQEPLFTGGSSASRSNTGGGATAIVSINSDGIVDLTIGTDGTWVPDSPPADPSQYQIKWVHNSGVTPSSSMTQNVYYSLSTNRNVYLYSNGPFLSSSITVYVQRIGGSTVSKVFTLDAESNNN